MVPSQNAQPERPGVDCHLEQPMIHHVVAQQITKQHRPVPFSCSVIV